MQGQNNYQFMQDQKKKNPLPDFCVYLDKKEEGKK